MENLTECLKSQIDVLKQEIKELKESLQMQVQS